MITGLFSVFVPVIVQAGVIAMLFALIFRGMRFIMKSISRGELSV